MKHINLDREPERIKQFVRSLEAETGGSILELDGTPVLHVVPVTEQVPVDQAKLKAAILARRDSSRALNDEWHAVDRQAWDRISDSER